MPITLNGRMSHARGSQETRLIQCPCEAVQNPPIDILLADTSEPHLDALTAATDTLLNAGYNDGDCLQLTGDYGRLGDHLDAFVLTDYVPCPNGPCQQQ
jgi:hypothetical protein